MKINQADTAINHFHLCIEHSLDLSLQERVYNYIVDHPRKPDWTIGELAFGMELEKSTISARRREMIDQGILEMSEKRTCSISGIRCETVRLSSMVKEN